jgi:osmoprotectant transport system permease protein
VGADLEFFGRPEWAAVKKAYNLHFATRRQYQSNFMYRAVADGDINVISGYSSDGRIEEYNLKVLTDPRHALPPYDAIVLVSPKYANDPKVIDALKPLLGKISLKMMQHANYLVDRKENKRSPADAAKWLETQISE